MAKFKKNSGFVALIAVLMISAIVLALAITVSLFGASEIKMAFSENKSTQAFDYGESCLEEGVYRLKQSWANTSTSLLFDRGYCIINAVVSGSQATIDASGTAETQTDNYTRAIRMIINDDFDVVSWQEPGL
jgi:hypothetical protein